MDKVNFNPFSEILVEDFLRQSDYIGDAFELFIADFLCQSTAVLGLNITAQAVANMTIYAKPGRIYQEGLQGQLVANLDPALVITAAHPTYARIDRICAQYRELPDTPETRNVMVDTVSRQVTQKTVMTRVAGTIDFLIVPGVAAPGPAAPTIPDGWISLAQVNIRANTTSVLQTDIIDERPILKSLATHDHSGGIDGAKIDYNSLNNKPDLAQYISSTTWKANSIVSSGDICYAKSSGNGYKLMECIAAGTSGTNEPIWGNIGTTIADGTVTWKICDVRQGTSIGKLPALVDIGGGIAGLPAISGKLLTDIGGVPTGTIMHVMSKITPAGFLKSNGAEISRTVYANLTNTSLTIPTTGNKTTGSAIITNIPTTVDMAIGMPIEGAGIPVGTTVASINSLTSITLSANLTATATSGAFTVYPFGNGDGSTTVNLPDLRGEHLRAFDDSRNADTTGYTVATTNGSAVISGIPDTSFMYVGMSLSGAGIPAGATIASITSLTAITMSANATATSSKLVTFTGRRFGSWQADDLKSHVHPTIVDGASMTGNQQIATNRANGNTGATGGSETRGRNFAFPVYIKY